MKGCQPNISFVIGHYIANLIRLVLTESLIKLLPKIENNHPATVRSEIDQSFRIIVSRKHPGFNIIRKAGNMIVNLSRYIISLFIKREYCISIPGRRHIFITNSDKGIHIIVRQDTPFF